MQDEAIYKNLYITAGLHEKCLNLLTRLEGTVDKPHTYSTNSRKVNNMIQKFNVKINGLTPYMQHRMDDIKLAEWEQSRGQIIENAHINTETEKIAMFHAYTDKDGNFYIPSEHFKQCFLNGSKAVKGKVGAATKSMKQVVAGQWFITPPVIPFRKFDEVDIRSAVNQNVKARVITKRPKWNVWNCEFTLEVHNDTLTLDTIKNIIYQGGSFVGAGSYRPEHGGEFGRFTADIVKL